MITAEALSTRKEKGFISKNRDKIGRGSSRTVYDIGDNKNVVKYARKNNKGGKEQNYTEYIVYNDASLYINILCPVFDISEDNNTLIMGKAIPIRSKNIEASLKEKVNKFKRKLQFFRTKVERITQYNKPKNIKELRKLIKEKFTLSTEEKNILKSKFFNQIYEVITHFQLLRGDVYSEHSWGYYKGKFVLIDYGCTLDIYKKYHNPYYKPYYK